MNITSFWVIVILSWLSLTSGLPVRDPSEEIKRVNSLILTKHPEFHNLQLLVDHDLLQIELFENQLYEEDTELVYLREDGSNASRRLNTNCYYNGNVFRGHDNIGWASVFLCSNKSLHGILTIGLHTYSLESDGGSYVLKLIGQTQTEFKNDLHRIKRHEHVVPENTIEVSLVVDEVMSNHYNDSYLEPYLLDLMNTVSHLFRHPSTGSIIKTALVQIIVFQKNELAVRTDNDRKTFKNRFCEWKFNQHINGDIAILLTRRVICESEDRCGIVGITNLRGMCHTSKSCAVVRDTGLSTAFTITHEIGHSLGVSHDGDRNAKCDSGFFIMAASFEDSTNPHGWSNCSRQQLNEFFSSPQSACLRNAPSSTVSPPLEVVPLLGKNYTLDDQCALLFGNSAKACEKTNCSALWCSLEDGEPCNYTQYSPPAAGSACSVNSADNSQHLCYRGECVDSDTVSTVVHGSWGEWGPWSECSASCGRGVHHSDRYCNSPIPQFSGSYCKGIRRRYRTCKVQDCALDDKSYRDQRCATLGALKMHQANSLSSATDDKWISVEEEYIASFAFLNPCKLYCKKKGHDGLFVLEDSVQNGVSCMTSSVVSGVCIDDKCIKVGCDGKLDTPTYEDRCGKTCGDNSTCTDIRGTLTTEYQEIIIPNESRNIHIQEIVHSNSYIVATDTHTGDIVNGSFRHAFLSGAWWYFSNNEQLQSISSTGPIRNAVQIKVFVVDNKAVFNYSFTAPSDHLEQQQHYRWSAGGWSQCSALCGHGFQTRTVNCTQQQGGELADARKCASLPKPASSKVCHLDSCENYRWQASPWSKCNTNCGNGTKKRTVICQHYNTSTIVEDGYCTSTSVKPDERVACNSSLCPSWEYGKWSQCSVTCGDGVQSRSAHCLTSAKLPSQDCDKTTKPNKEQRPCSIQCNECTDTLAYCHIIPILEFCNYFNYEQDCCKSCSKN